MGLRLEVAIDPSAHKIAIDELHRNARGCGKISRVYSQKPLDKPPDLCYNKGVKRKGLVNSQSGRCFSPRKFLEKSSKNLLTYPLKCDTIRVQKERDGNPETRAAHESEVRPVPNDPTARCSYLRNINVNQCPRG